MRVAILKGGRGLERQVSLRSGARVEDALHGLGHEVIAIDVGAGLVATLKSERPDAAFVALHGPGGEDGTVQELLEILGIPYTGPGVRACIRSIDKVAAKHELRAAGIPTPDWAAFSALAFRELGAAETLEEIGASLGFPLVIKPAAGGSSLGVRFAATLEEVPEALVAAFSYDDRVLLERHVEGREIAVSLINGIALPAVEVRPHDEDRFNYEARYEIGRTEYVCPAPLGAAEGAVLDAALRTWDVLGFDGFARVDLILAPEGPQVLEANAVPGLTDTSLLPMAAEAAGLGFEQLVQRVLELTAERRGPARNRLSPLSGGGGRRAAGCAVCERSSGVAGGEVLGRDVVEEVLEALDDLLLILDLMLELDRGLVDHFLGREDRRLAADRQRDRVGGA